MKLFAQLSKVDEEKRLVYGRAAEEQVDRADEIMDYQSSKPHFQKWSQEIAADTGGKNLGNVRAMHGKVAAGALKQIDFNDTQKAVDVVAHIVDDNEWKKVLAGVYTGFSIGGSYVGEKKVEKMDGRDVTRYTAKPTEISLVDRPCMAGAKFFDVQKADGTTVQVEFQPADDMEVTGSADDVQELGKAMNELGLSVRDVIAKIRGAKKGEFPGAKDGEEAAADEEAEEEDGESEGAPPNTGKDRFSAGKEPKGKAPPPEEDAAAAEDEEKCADKAAPATLQKVDESALRKLVEDALAPLQKTIADQADQIKKLQEQPEVPRVRLRAVSKSEDGDPNGEKPAEKVEPIVDDLGDKHEAAGMIKALMRTGGAPLHASLRK